VPLGCAVSGKKYCKNIAKKKKEARLGDAPVAVREGERGGERGREGGAEVVACFDQCFTTHFTTHFTTDMSSPGAG
jgi:hypothetical protein